MLDSEFYVMMAEAGAATEKRSCSCYPGEGPLPCPLKHALRDCWRSVVMDETQKNIVALKSRDRQPHEQALLDYLMRVRCALELETSDFPNIQRESAPLTRA